MALKGDQPQEVKVEKSEPPNEGLQQAIDGAWNQPQGDRAVANAGGNPEQGAMHLASLTQRPGDNDFQTRALTDAVNNFRQAGLIDENVANLLLAARQNPEILKKAQPSA